MVLDGAAELARPGRHLAARNGRERMDLRGAGAMIDAPIRAWAAKGKLGTNHGLRPTTKIQILTIAGTRDEVQRLGDSYCQDGFRIVRIEIKEVEQ